MIIGWSLPAILINASEYFGIPSLGEVGYFLGTSSGVTVGLSRLLDAKLFREIYKKFLTRKQKENYMIRRVSSKSRAVSQTSSLTEPFEPQISIRSNSINCFGDLFESMSKRVLSI